MCEETGACGETGLCVYEESIKRRGSTNSGLPVRKILDLDCFISFLCMAPLVCVQQSCPFSGTILLSSCLIYSLVFGMLKSKWDVRV